MIVKLFAAAAGFVPRIAYRIAEVGMLTMWKCGTALCAALLCAGPRTPLISVLH